MENGRLKTMNLARKRNVFHFNPLYGVLWGINIINVELKLGQAPSLHRSLRSPAASAMWMRVSFALHAMPKDRRGALLLYYILYIYMYIYILISLISLISVDIWWEGMLSDHDDIINHEVFRGSIAVASKRGLCCDLFGKWHPSPSAPLAAGLAEMPISSFAESSKPASIGLMWHKPPVGRNKPPVKIRTLPAFDRWFRTKQTRSSGGIFVSDLLNIQNYEIDLRCIPPKWENGTV